MLKSILIFILQLPYILWYRIKNKDLANKEYNLRMEKKFNKEKDKALSKVDKKVEEATPDDIADYFKKQR